MKNIYNAPNKEVAAAELDNLEKKWGGKYPYAILSWRNKWDDLTVFFSISISDRYTIFFTASSEGNESFDFVYFLIFPFRFSMRFVV